MKPNLAIALVAATIGIVFLAPELRAQAENDIRLNVVVSATGNLRSDGKGAYYTGKDYVAAWLNSARSPGPWRDMAFDICMSWPFGRFPGGDGATAPGPTGTPGNRTLIHRMTDPVPHGGGKPLGVFAGVSANDLALAKPLTSTVTSYTDMTIGSSLSPQSAEVRFCDSASCYSLIFGEKSVFGYPVVNGAGTTRPIVSRISETTWTISFPPRTIARLWSRAGEANEIVADLGLYYYEGSLRIQRQ
ncbi:MAG: hypothetical protein ABR537_14465 [Gemmatimonadales bacterium]